MSSSVPSSPTLAQFSMLRGWMNRLAAIVSVSSLLTCPAHAAASNPIRQTMSCPTQLTNLMPLLLRDLPSYANRVNQRAYRRDEVPDIPGYVLVAGQPDYQPLTLTAGERSPLPAGASSGSEDPAQIFFTTLERQYVDGRSAQLQHHHWLFLALTETHGWRLVLLFSTIDNDTNLSSPPQDASQGVIAQAIRLWLRDCQTGAIEVLLNSPSAPPARS